jgi:hypothetical protein
MIQKFAHLLFFLSVFFLPWQTQAVFATARIAAEPSPYGVAGIYVVEAMIIFAFVLRGREFFTLPTMRSNRALLIFLAAAFFSLGFSQVEWVGWFHLFHVVTAVLLYLLLTDNRTDMRRVVTLFLLGLLVPVCVGWYQVLSGSSPESTLLGVSAKDAATQGIAVVETAEHRLLRAYGTFPHPNIFGGYVAAGIVALAWLSCYARNRQQLVGFFGFAVLIGATFVVTFSRSSWLGLCLAFLVLFVLMLWQRRPPPRRVMALMSVCAVSVLSTLAVFHTEVFSRFDPTQRIEIISMQERASQYQSYGDVFLSSPIIGVGPAAYTFVLEHLDPGHPAWSYQPIHNVYLLLLAELGLVGIIVLGFGLLAMNPFTKRSIKKNGNLFASALAVFLFTIGLFDHYLWTLWPGLALVALCLGFIVSLVFQRSLQNSRSLHSQAPTDPTLPTFSGSSP